jgi:hypothetical protein
VFCRDGTTRGCRLRTSPCSGRVRRRSSACLRSA